MIATKAGIIAAVLVLMGLIALAADGFTPVIAPLVTLAVLVVLVAGGSFLHDRGSAGRR